VASQCLHHGCARFEFVPRAHLNRSEQHREVEPVRSFFRERSSSKMPGRHSLNSEAVQLNLRKEFSGYAAAARQTRIPAHPLSTLRSQFRSAQTVRTLYSRLALPSARLWRKRFFHHILGNEILRPSERYLQRVRLGQRAELQFFCAQLRFHPQVR